jgi:hypothetical protein
MAAVANRCRCRPGTREWDARAALATFDYRDRAASIASQFTGPRERFSELVRRIEVDGIDPAGAWSEPIARVQERLDAASAAARDALVARNVVNWSIPPLDREPCHRFCQRHREHLYIACFDEPTTIRSRDKHPLDRENHPIEHYVGYTTVVPFRRIMDHGRTAAQSIVLIVPGTKAEEAELKINGSCPSCDRPLWYFRLPIDELVVERMRELAQDRRAADPAS